MSVGDEIVKIKTVVCLAMAVLFVGSSISQAQSTDKKQESAAERIQRATNKLNQKQRYKLAYKLKKDEVVRWTVEHTVSTKFQMAGELEESTSRSTTTKVWKVANVDSLGNMTFVHELEAINMWQQVGETEPVAYNSKTDKTIPEEYKSVAENIGKPLVVFSISPNGKIIDRKSNLRQDNFGAGNVTIPLPEEAIPIGHKWNVPTILQATDDQNQNKKLKARILYELARVKGDHAYIKFRTEVLTPVTSEKIKSTIMQQMTKGYLVFDMKRGRQILKQVEWDEKAQGFEGPDSFLKYVGRMSEKLADSDPSQQNGSSALAPLKTDTATKPVELKTRDGKPIMRK